MNTALCEERLVRGPLLGIPVGRHAGEVDTERQLLRLERRSRVARHLSTLWEGSADHDLNAYARMLGGREHAALAGSEQFLARVAEAFSIPDVSRALASFRRLMPSDSLEELTKLLNDHEFQRLHEQVQYILTHEEESIAESVRDRTAPDGPFVRADIDAYEGTHGVSLKDAITTGIEVRLRTEGLALLLGVAGDSSRLGIPLTEFVKNQRIVDIGDHPGSKISLAIHDLIDHLWFMNLLGQTGVLDRHSGLLDAIRNGGVRRAFSRESEMFASIAFGVRYRHTMPHGMQPLVRPEALLSIVERHRHPTLEPAQEVLRYLCRRESGTGRFLAPSRTHDQSGYDGLVGTGSSLRVSPNRRSVEYASLGFAFSNYITELDEQRRKHGKIKVFAGETVVGELNPFSPAFIALFVEAHREVLIPKNKHLDTLTAAHILVESHLQKICRREIDSRSDPLVLSLDALNDMSIFERVRPEVLRWIRQNPGFVAARRSAW